MRDRRPFPFISGLLLLCTVRAQQAEVTRYDVDQGLPQSMVNHVLQDADGFMWFGTGDGLARFDGSRFVVYKHDALDSSSISHNVVWGIAEKDAHHLWVGTRSRLDLLDRRTGHFTHIRSGLPATADGCWQPVHTTRDAALFYSPLNACFLSIDGLGKHLLSSGHSPCYALRFMGNWRVGMVLWPDSLCTFDPVRGSSGAIMLPLSSGEKVLDLIDIGTGLLLTTTLDAWMWDPENGRMALPPATASVMRRAPGPKHIARDTDGALWVGVSDVGLMKLREDLSIERIYPLLPARERPLTITTIAFDHQGDIWVGTDGKGVFKISPQAIKFDRIMPGFGATWEPHSYFVRGFAQWDSTRVLVAFYQGGFALFDERSEQLSPIELKGVPPLSDVGHLLNDSAGRVWMMADKEVLVFHPPAATPAARIRCDAGSTLLLDPHGGVVIVSMSGPGRWNGSRILPLDYRALTMYIDSLRNVPHVVVLDDHQRFWTSPVTASTNVWDPEGRLALSTKDHAQWTEDVRLTGLTIDPNGSYWTTTNDGLFFWDASSLTINLHLTTHDGLPDQFLYGMLPAGDGTWWISTNNGLSHFDPTEGTFSNYSVVDGMQSKEFNSNAYLRSASGRLYFGGVNGINHFIPEDVRPDTDAAQVRLVRLLRDDQEMDSLDLLSSTPSVTLSYTRNRLELDIAVLEFTSPQRNRFRYRIRGYIDEWRTSIPGTPLVLEHMPDGNYVIEAQGINGDGVLGPMNQLLNISVPLPFWASRWAYVLAGSLLVAGIGLLAFASYRRRVHTRLILAEQEMKELRQRTRLAKEIHDDVGSGLARIAAVSRSSLRIQEAELRFEKVSTISGELLGNLRDVVWMNDPRQDDLAVTLMRIKDHAFDLFEGSGMEVRADFPDPLPQRVIGGAFRRDLYLIAKEAMHNAKKYAGATNVRVTFTLTPDAFHLDVADNGVGMALEQAATGNGLRNMRQRAADIGASFTMIKSLEGGVSVRLDGPSSCLDA